MSKEPNVWVCYVNPVSHEVRYELFHSPGAGFVEGANGVWTFNTPHAVEIPHRAELNKHGHKLSGPEYDHWNKCLSEIEAWLLVSGNPVQSPS